MLSRRGSAQTSTVTTPTVCRYASLKLRTSDSVVDSKRRSPRVPMELIDHIISFAVLLFLGTAAGPSSFSSINTLSLVSTAFRQITLRHFFRQIIPNSPRHWAGLFNLLSSENAKNKARDSVGGFVWVRSFCSSSASILHEPERLGFLTSLRILSLDFAHEGIHTQYQRAKQLLQAFETCKPAICLESLTLVKLAYIDVALLRLIARVFPELLDLYMDTTSRIKLDCCVTCYEESLSLIIHSPIPRKYLSPELLATAFGTALRPLQKLRHLSLGIFLSPEVRIESHINHLEDADWGVDSIANCHLCEKFAKQARRDELVAGLKMARYLKALKTVTWSTYFSLAGADAGGGGGDDDNLVSEGQEQECVQCVCKGESGKDEGQLGEQREDDLESEMSDEDLEAEAEDDSSESEGEIMRTVMVVLRGNGRVRIRRIY